MAVKQSGQVAILNFPQTNLTAGKPRPALLLAPVPGPYSDWLVCMISTQTRQALMGADESVTPSDDDFSLSGLRIESVIRVHRLAVVSDNLLVGTIGQIGESRLHRIRATLANWILGNTNNA